MVIMPASAMIDLSSDHSLSTSTGTVAQNISGTISEKNTTIDFGNSESGYRSNMNSSTNRSLRNSARPIQKAERHIVANGIIEVIKLRQLTISDSMIDSGLMWFGHVMMP